MMNTYGLRKENSEFAAVLLAVTIARSWYRLLIIIKNSHRYVSAAPTITFPQCSFSSPGFQRWVSGVWWVSPEARVLSLTSPVVVPVSPQTVIIPIISSIVVFPAAALTVICCLRYRAKRARRRAKQPRWAIHTASHRLNSVQ